MNDPVSTGSPSPWEQLFGRGAAKDNLVRFDWFVLRKRGHAFLFLPREPRFAREAMMLYPAQTPFARFARRALRAALQLHLPVPFEREHWAASPDNDFLGFIAGLTGLAPEVLPTPAVLAGNPAGPGPRYVLLLNDGGGKPKIVIKAGTTPAAKELIRAEERILTSLPPSLPGAPRILHSFKSRDVEAFAQEYFPGDSPRAWDASTLGALLDGWIDTTRLVRIADIPAWQRLVERCSRSPGFAAIADVLAPRQVHPVIWHGDFVPWNVKVSPKDGRWTVLDWERAESTGMPGWDWFHFIIQTEILVRKRSAKQLIEAVESLLACLPFRAYADKTKIVGVERALLKAYLLYNAEVIRPAEGLTPAQELLHDLGSF